MIKHYMPPVIGYHGCEKSIAEEVLNGKAILNNSQNDYDWLGSGVYFWVDSFERGYEWAKKSSSIKDPYVIGAFIYPKNCLNLTDYGVSTLLKESYKEYKMLCEISGIELAKNDVIQNGIYMRRKLDCSIINYIHSIREDQSKEAFDSVYGVFEEGSSIYPNSGINEKTHIQLAVRNHDCIIGYFRPKELSEYYIKETNNANHKR